MKRCAFVICALLLACSLCFVSVYAEERSFTYVAGADSTAAGAADALEKALPDELGELKGSVLDTVKNGTAEFDGESIFERLYTSVRDELGGPMKLFFTLLSLIICASLFKALSQTVRNAGVSSAFTLCSSLCFCGAVCVPLLRIAERTEAFLTWLATFVAALVPVFSSLCVAGGSVASAAYASSGAYMLTVLIEEIFAELLLPACRLLLAIAVTASVSPLELSGIVKVIKDLFTTALAFLMMLNSAVYAFGNHIAAAKDGVAMRAVRFAAGSFIPVVGGAVGEAMRTVAGSLSVIKAGVGWVCCAAVIIILLPPIVSVLLYRTAIELAGAAARLCSLNTEARLLESAASVCNLLAALMAASAVIFVLAVTLFIKTAVA